MLSIHTRGAVEGAFDSTGAGVQVCWSFYSPITSLTVTLAGPVSRSITEIADGRPPGSDPDQHTGGCKFERLPPGRYTTSVDTVGDSTWQIDVSALRSNVVSVPDVRGEKRHTVSEELAEHGLKADLRRRCDLDLETADGIQELGEIVDVEGIGKLVPVGTRITVYSLDFRLVGSVVGEDVKRAREALEASGYEVRVSGEGRTVHDQSPAADAAVCPRSTIRLHT